MGGLGKAVLMNPLSIGNSLRLLSIAAVVVFSAVSPVQADTVNVFMTERTNSSPAANKIGVELKIADTTGGVQVTATVKEIVGQLMGAGDILAVWFDVKAGVNLAGVSYSPPYTPS